MGPEEEEVAEWTYIYLLQYFHFWPTVRQCNGVGRRYLLEQL